MSRKEELLFSAAKIIYEEGIQQLTIDYLAEKSSITKGCVLYHFDNKENLLVKMNEMIIDLFERQIDMHIAQLNGIARYTRAYAYATLDYVRAPETALLPAVLMTSLEIDACNELWRRASNKWDTFVAQDSGNKEQNIQLKFLCDGIWFSLMYNTDSRLNKYMEQVIKNMCNEVERAAL